MTVRFGTFWGFLRFLRLLALFETFCDCLILLVLFETYKDIKSHCDVISHFEQRYKIPKNFQTCRTVRDTLTVKKFPSDGFLDGLKSTLDIP